MRSNTLKTITLVGSVLALASVGEAQAVYSNYSQANAAVGAQFDAGDYLGAQKAAEQALTLAKAPSERIGALISLGLSYSQRGLFDQAREQWVKALAVPQISSQDSIAAQTAIALSYSQQNNGARARLEWEKIVANPDVTPKDKSFALFAIAVTYIGEKNETAARETLLSVAQDPAFDATLRVGAYTQISASFTRDKQFDQARTTLESAFYVPGITARLAIVVQAGIAQSYQDQGNIRRASEEFSSAQTLAVNQYNDLFAAKQFEEAHKMLDLYFTLKYIPFFMDAAMHVNLGYSLQAEGKPVEARAALEAVIQKQYPGLTPQEQVALRFIKQGAQLAIARTYVREGNKNQAQQILQELLSLTTVQPNVRKGAQELLDSLG